MAQQLGRKLLIKRGATATAGPTSTIAGVQSRTFSMAVNAVETTVSDPDNPDAAPEYTAIPGISNKSFDCAGLFDSTTAGKAVADDARLGRIWFYDVVVPGYGTISGQRIVTNFQFTGDTEPALGFSCTFTPAGPQTFVAEV